MAVAVTAWWRWPAWRQSADAVVTVAARWQRWQLGRGGQLGSSSDDGGGKKKKKLKTAVATVMETAYVTT